MFCMAHSLIGDICGDPRGAHLIANSLVSEFVAIAPFAQHVNEAKDFLAAFTQKGRRRHESDSTIT